MAQMKKIKYGVFDTATNLFASTEGIFPYGVQWTANFNEIRLFGIAENALEWVSFALRGVNNANTVPTAKLVEVTVTLDWIEAEISITETPTYKKRYEKFRKDYDDLLPAYRRDPDAMTKKSWERFKAARSYLRLVGEPVE